MPDHTTYSADASTCSARVTTLSADVSRFSAEASTDSADATTLSADVSNFSADAATWFDISLIADQTWLISEPGHANSYLLTSETGSLLFDTGTGLASIADAIADIVRGPLTIVNSHSHLDHVGGNASVIARAQELQLQDVCGHPATAYTETEAPLEFLELYAREFTKVTRKYEKFRELDQDYFYALSTQPAMRPMPDTSHWQVPFAAPTRTLHDGELLTVGRRTFVTVHTPGHTPDSLALYEPATRALYAGDTIITAAMWLHGDGANLPQLIQSLEKLERLNIHTIYCAHNLTPAVPGTYLTRVREAAQAIHAGLVPPTKGTDLLGQCAHKHTHNGVSMLLPILSQGAC